MLFQLCYGSPEQLWIQALADLEKNRLVPVVRIDEILLEKPALNRSQRRQADHRTGGHGSRLGHGDNRSQLSQRLMLENLEWRHLQTRLLRLSNELNGQNRVAAQFEEVVRWGHSLYP